MISLDSPVASVLGAQTKQGKAKKITEGLGLRTVGDLLHHFPRRYVPTGELTKVQDLHEGEMLTVVGEITESEVHSYQDRRTHRLAYRLDTTLSTDGPSLRMSFFAKAKHVSDWHAGRLPVGRRGIFIGQVSSFRGRWQLTNPTMALFGVDDSDETFGAAVASIKALFPLYPQTKGVDSWDLQRAIAFALTVVDDVTDPLPAGLRDEHGLPDLITAFRHVHAPDSWAQVTGAPSGGSGSTRRW
jgi:ATP-dependent DNA helicase RecG